MYPLCFRVRQFPPLHHSPPNSRIFYEIERSAFDLVTYRQLTSVLCMWNTASFSKHKQLKLLFGFDLKLLLYFPWQHEQPRWAFFRSQIMEVCRNIQNVTGQKGITKKLHQKITRVFISEPKFSHPLWSYNLMCWRCDSLFQYKDVNFLCCIHLKMTAQQCSLFPFTVYRSKSSVALSSTPTQFALLQWLGNGTLI